MSGNRRRKSSRLSLKRVMDEFRRSEDSTAHRKGTFKIDVPFEDALKLVLKKRPAAKSRAT